MLILILDNGQQLNYYKDYYLCLMDDHLVYPYMTTATQPYMHMLGVCVAEALIITTRPTQPQHTAPRGCSLSGVMQ